MAILQHAALPCLPGLGLRSVDFTVCVEQITQECIMLYGDSPFYVGCECKLSQVGYPGDHLDQVSFEILLSFLNGAFNNQCKPELRLAFCDSKNPLNYIVTEKQYMC